MADFYYRISNPADVRDLTEQMPAWIASGNPKAQKWLPQPDKPDPDATWQNGEWIMPPPPLDYKIWPNVQAFMEAFTPPEKAAIELSTDATIAFLRIELTTWLDAVHGDDSRVIAGLDRLVELGIITTERRSEILATPT